MGVTFCEFILHGFKYRIFSLKFISNACVKPGKIFTVMPILVAMLLVAMCFWETHNVGCSRRSVRRV